MSGSENGSKGRAKCVREMAALQEGQECHPAALSRSLHFCIPFKQTGRNRRNEISTSRDVDLLVENMFSKDLYHFQDGPVEAQRLNIKGSEALVFA